MQCLVLSALDRVIKKYLSTDQMPGSSLMAHTIWAVHLDGGSLLSVDGVGLLKIGSYT